AAVCGFVAPTADAGVRAAPSRLALRRAGRVRGRLVRTSRSSPLALESLGGMARLLPIRSRAPAQASKHRRARIVSVGRLVATVACEPLVGRSNPMAYHQGSTFERLRWGDVQPANGSGVSSSRHRQAGPDAVRSTERTHMSVVEMQELEEVK